MKETDRAKEWLWGYRDAVRDYRRLLGEYAQLVASQEGPGAVGYDGMPKAHGDPADLSSLMAVRESFYGRVCRAREKAAVALAERAALVDRLPSHLQRDVVSMRYLQLVDGRPLEWEAIAEEAGYSRVHVLDVHGEALQEVARALDGLPPGEVPTFSD